LKLSLQFLKDSGIQLIACTEKTQDDMYKLDYSPPTAIIVGSEEDGVSAEFLKMCDAKAKIPMIGKIASLNVSVATGVILYEAIRQRD
jgi:23S rRNA (guanosine2251-2'-O)-methyltransferase